MQRRFLDGHTRARDIAEQLSKVRQDYELTVPARVEDSANVLRAYASSLNERLGREYFRAWPSVFWGVGSGFKGSLYSAGASDCVEIVHHDALLFNVQELLFAREEERDPKYNSLLSRLKRWWKHDKMEDIYTAAQKRLDRALKAKEADWELADSIKEYDWGSEHMQLVSSVDDDLELSNEEPRTPEEEQAKERVRVLIKSQPDYVLVKLRKVWERPEYKIESFAKHALPWGLIFDARDACLEDKLSLERLMGCLQGIKKDYLTHDPHPFYPALKLSHYANGVNRLLGERVFVDASDGLISVDSRGESRYSDDAIAIDLQALLFMRDKEPPAPTSRKKLRSVEACMEQWHQEEEEKIARYERLREEHAGLFRELDAFDWDSSKFRFDDPSKRYHEDELGLGPVATPDKLILDVRKVKSEPNISVVIDGDD